MSSNSVVVRSACPEDFDSLCEIVASAFPASIRWNAPKVIRRRYWRRVLSFRCEKLLLAEEEGNIVGFVEVIVGPALDRKRDKRLTTLCAGVLVLLLKPWVIVRHLIRSRVSYESVPLARVPVGSDSRGWIELMAVRDSAQGRGIGRMLLDAAKEMCIAAGCQQIGLCVDVRNSRALMLYEKNGYSVVRQSGARLTCVQVLPHKPIAQVSLIEETS